jgi:hypothetical protein
MTLREEQRVVVDKCKAILSEKGLVYLAAEPRCGKTIMSMHVAHENGYRRILFVTKLKAISSIQSDYAASGLKFVTFHVVNFEQVLKTHPPYDLVIIDEAHGTGAYPKPTKRAKDIKLIAGKSDIMYLSATPTAESHSQIFNQLWISSKSPFIQYANFYKFSKDFVNVKTRKVNGWTINDYSHAIQDKIKLLVDPIMVTFSQQQAGFTSFVDEEVLTVPIHPDMYKLMAILKKDKVYKMKNGKAIICDTPVKMQSVFHQLSSGTIKVDDDRFTMDRSKAEFIKNRFAGKKIAIFFKFIQERELLAEYFPNHTSVPEEFNNSTDKVFLCQMVSGREGLNLSSADCLVMYNIDFSATTYWQVRARMQTKDRIIASKIFWIFSDRGIERFIHKAVNSKLTYTSSYFLKDIKLIGV